MDTCKRCNTFLQDWFTQPFSPKEVLYNDIHPKRLLQVLPYITPIFIRLIKDMTYYDMHGIFLTIEGIRLNATVDILFETREVIQKKLMMLSWSCMTEHYSGKAAGEIQIIEDILKDACVCKGCEKELIGYYLTNMIHCLKDIHSSHTGVTTVD